MNCKLRDDLKFNSPGEHESTFVEIIIPNKTNIITGCIYRRPNSLLSINDFNIGLLKHDSIESIGDFYNNMTSHFFAPYVMQPTRLISKTLIDNIFINSIEYSSYSGNITIQLSDHLFQFVILKGFFKDLLRKRLNIYERNFKHFNEREFGDLLNRMGWDSILSIERNDPNISIENFHNNIIYILDEFAPFKKLTKSSIN